MTAQQKKRLSAIAAARFSEPMSLHTTLGVGGKAEAFVAVTSIAMLQEVLRFASEESFPYLVIGGGSNLLVRDGGLKGIVISLQGEFTAVDLVRESGGMVSLAAGSAVATATLLRRADDLGLAGFEVMAGVPGTIGGNIRMNAGTRAGSIADVVEEVTIVERSGREVTLTPRALRFEYRSVKLPPGAVIARVVCKLKRAEPGAGRATIRALLEHRRQTQPVATENCGCAFKNPGKLSAGQLIDEAGLKGIRVGGARISTLHANFIINEGTATARDIIVLMNLVRDRVREHAGITLEPEVVIVGGKGE